MAKLVYALVGNDPFLQVMELGKILRDLPADVQRADFEGETVELAEVLDELRSLAMFGSYKLVVVRDGDEFVSRFREQLEQFLQSPPSGATLILRLSSLPKNQRIYKIIQKVGEVRPCATPADVVKWTVGHARSAHKATLTPDAARALVELVGAETGRLDTEIAKLAVAAGDEPITVNHVGENVASVRQRELSEITALLAAGEHNRAVLRWRELVRTDPSAEFRAVTWITNWVTDVRLYLRSPEEFFRRSAWKYKGGDISVFQRTAKSIGKEKVGRLVESLAEADRRSKSGLGDAAENVERFLLTAFL